MLGIIFFLKKKVHGFHAVLDKDVWLRAYAFLVEGPLLGGLALLQTGLRGSWASAAFARRLSVVISVSQV